MDKYTSDYYNSKNLFKKTLDYREKQEGKITAQMIARIHCDDVEYYDEEYEIIFEILFQNAIIEKMGFIYSSYLPLLSEVITEFDAGYKFTVLDEEEYEDLKSIVEKLKGYLAEHSK